MSNKTYPQQLQQLFDETIKSTNNADFFKRVANYGKTIKEDLLIERITSELHKDYEEDIKKLKAVYEPFIQEWRRLAPDLIEIAKKCGIQDDPIVIVRQEQHWLNECLAEKVSYFNDPSHYFGEYGFLFQKIIDSGHKKELTPVHADKNGNMLLWGKYNTIKTYFDQYEVIKDQSIWWAHYQVIRLASGAFGLGIQDQLFHDESSVDSLYLYEFRKIISESHESFVLLRRNRYEEWLQRLHAFIYPRLVNGGQSQNSSKKNGSGETKNASITTAQGRCYVSIDGAGKICIADESARKSKLIRALEPFGVPKTIDYVFDRIRISHDRENSLLRSSYENKRLAEEKKIIRGVVKELQREGILKGKFRVEFPDPRQVVGVFY